MRPLAAALVFAASACAPAQPPSAAPPPLPRCEPGDTPTVRDVIYLGRNRPDGGIVTDAEWEAFLDSVVTPKFPEVAAEYLRRFRQEAVLRERLTVCARF